MRVGIFLAHVYKALQVTFFDCPSRNSLDGVWIVNGEKEPKIQRVNVRISRAA